MFRHGNCQLTTLLTAVFLCAKEGLTMSYFISVVFHQSGTSIRCVFSHDRASNLHEANWREWADLHTRHGLRTPLFSSGVLFRHRARPKRRGELFSAWPSYPEERSLRNRCSMSLFFSSRDPSSSPALRVE